MLIDQFIEAIKPHINFKDIKTILDLGSRDLEQSIELHSVFPNAHIYAFEPNPESFAKCKAKAPSYVTVWPYAVLDYNGETEFYSVVQKDNHGASSVFYPTDEVVGVDPVDGLNRLTVPCKRIDTWAKENGVTKIDLVWADVQSSELPMLAGFGQMIYSVRAIATEAATGALYYGNRQYEPSTYEGVDKFMREKGFRQLSYLQPWAMECDLTYLNEKFIKP